MVQDRILTTRREAARRRPEDPDRHYLIYCDESGLHGTKLMGFGTLWMTYERRGDFRGIIDDLSRQHFAPSEIKWERVKRQTYPFFAALVDEFFARNWLMFHCLLISNSAAVRTNDDKALVDRHRNRVRGNYRRVSRSVATIRTNNRSGASCRNRLDSYGCGLWPYGMEAPFKCVADIVGLRRVCTFRALRRFCSLLWHSGIRRALALTLRFALIAVLNHYDRSATVLIALDAQSRNCFNALRCLPMRAGSEVERAEHKCPGGEPLHL
jgi:hypothetical protein